MKISLFLFFSKINGYGSAITKVFSEFDDHSQARWHPNPLISFSPVISWSSIYFLKMTFDKV